MNQQYRPSTFNLIPPVIKNLLIINVIFFLGTVIAESKFGVHLAHYLGMHFFMSELFKPYQLLTYMFMHGGFWHLFFNMFSLWMFGAAIENIWGPKRFLLYFLVTGIGAVLIHEGVQYIEFLKIRPQVSEELLNDVIVNGKEHILNNMNYTDALAGKLNSLINGPIVGASGAVFGILLAFGMLFPDTLIYVYFAIPIKAKWFVIIYGGFELISGYNNNPHDNVAHFAHLGGMIFGFLLIKYWKKKDKRPFAY